MRAATAVALVQGLPATALASPRLARVFGMSTSVDRRSVALTFDDGPHPEGTRAVLETLATLEAPATFFLSGEQVTRSPAVAREIAGQGHAIGVHGYRHVLLPLRGPRGTLRDLDHALTAIERATGARPQLYRPPYGVASPAALVAARTRRLRVVLWTRWGRDWERRATSESIAARVTRDLCGGDIVLLHDADHYAAPGSWRETVSALPQIVEAIRGRGLGLTTLT